MTIKEVLNNNDPEQLRALFHFDKLTPTDEVVLKFNIFCRKYYTKFYTSEDADFHTQVDEFTTNCYKGNMHNFLNIMFRGGAKTTRTKLFIAFSILNDEDHYRRYIKILSRDNANATQFVTDIYNLLIQPQVTALYPEVFAKTTNKREETMSSFTTATGIKVTAGTVGSSQRGQIQDESRPDLIIFDDIEDRSTLRSAVVTKALWDNMEEAKNGLAKDGSSIYLANYISEQGNVHKLYEKIDFKINIPIEELDDAGNGFEPPVPTWDRYSVEDIILLRKDAEDYEGEYLGRPNASKDIYFDRALLDKMPVRRPIEEISGFKIFRKYNPSHRYAGGMDIAGGVGLDSSTSVFIDFSTIPAQVVGTFHSNTILPEAFGDEIYSQANRFGGCLIAPENNKFDQTILKARQLGAKLYTGVGKIIKIHSVAPTTFGWNTNSLTKSTMYSGLREAIESGLIELNDEDLIKEAKSYTRNDIMDRDIDPRLSTRHFDLLTALAIAWQMKDHCRPSKRLMDVNDWLKKDTNEAI